MTVDVESAGERGEPCEVLHLNHAMRGRGQDRLGSFYTALWSTGRTWHCMILHPDAGKFRRGAVHQNESHLLYILYLHTHHVFLTMRVGVDRRRASWTFAPVESDTASQYWSGFGQFYRPDIRRFVSSTRREVH